ncbi:unnamed protein product [Danaus chrysippus]|uniref:(African queen) hypothetical protein n=1 Tax=Danaus chrysippus TaxID=151541 RepID=A0A8J2M9L0_9NEOP|nr:unnamed protein product [Danaus chrysippus]
MKNWVSASARTPDRTAYLLHRDWLQSKGNSRRTAMRRKKLEAISEVDVKNHKYNVLHVKNKTPTATPATVGTDDFDKKHGHDQLFDRVPVVRLERNKTNDFGNVSSDTDQQNVWTASDGSRAKSPVKHGKRGASSARRNSFAKCMDLIASSHSTQVNEARVALFEKTYKFLDTETLKLRKKSIDGSSLPPCESELAIFKSMLYCSNLVKCTLEDSNF